MTPPAPAHMRMQAALARHPFKPIAEDALAKHPLGKQSGMKNLAYAVEANYMYRVDAGQPWARPSTT
eukprot:7987419-Alexandrium_andersonii.AAC.1